jgi:LmbE family N-acetylglucosaminyl deacetylase
MLSVISLGLARPFVTTMVDPRPFSHRDRGTGEPAWLLDSRWDVVERLDLAAIVRRCPRVVLVAPHPDDESLAMGASLADLADAGVEVTVVMVTYGGTGPGSTVRRAEGERALAVLHPRIRGLWWDFQDGALGAAEAEMRMQLAELVDRDTLLLAPVECDGHADHDAVALATEAVALERSASLLGYPIWLWHWARPDDLDWERLRALAPSVNGLRAKAAALQCYTSQLTSEDGYPIVGKSVLDRARRVMETVLIPTAPDLAERVQPDTAAGRIPAEVAVPFDAMLTTEGEDPWRLDTSVYEKRRLAIILACLGRPRYRRALEVGCATGQLSLQLKDRADEVIGLDASAGALAVARTRSDAVRWVLGAAPADLPDDEVDLVVLSEVGYFLDGPDLLATLRGARNRLRPGGEIVVANWRGSTRDIPLDGPLVQSQAELMFDLPLRARYEDADLTVEVWGHPVSVHRDSGNEP